jgi:hypothetical protein
MNLVGKEGIERLHKRVLLMYRDYLKQCYRIDKSSSERKEQINLVKEAFSGHKVTETYGESSFLYSYAKTYYSTFTKFINTYLEGSKPNKKA